MKIILISDFHLCAESPIGRLDDTFVASLRKVSYILEYAKINKIKIAIQSGDFLHSSRSWRLHSALISLLNRYIDVDIYTILGQHDMYFRSEESVPSTSLGALITSKYLNLLTQKPTFVAGVAVYGCSYGQAVPKVKDKNDTNILVIHKEILEEPLFKNQQYIDAYDFLKEQKDYQLILAGDIHQKFFMSIKGRHIVNTGPLMRLEATKYNLQHQPCFAVLDVNTWNIDFVDVPCEPGEEVLSRKHLESKEKSKGAFDKFIETVRGTEFFGIDFMKNLQVYFKENEITDDVIEEIMALKEKETE